jgi:hypothetical protein
MQVPPNPPPPKSWIDPDTGKRIVRFIDEPGSASLYFNENNGRGISMFRSPPRWITTGTDGCGPIWPSIVILATLTTASSSTKRILQRKINLALDY